MFRIVEKLSWNNLKTTSKLLAKTRFGRKSIKVFTQIWGKLSKFCSIPGPESGHRAPTFTSHPLVNNTIEKRTTVITERRRGVRLNAELVLCAGVLKNTGNSYS